MRHYIGLQGLEKKVRRVLTDFDFDALGTLLPPKENLTGFIDTTRVGQAIPFSAQPRIPH